MAEGEPRYKSFEESKFGKVITKACCIPQRFILCFLGFMAIVHVYTLRISLSQAITTMVIEKNKTSSSETVCSADDESDSDKRIYGEYDWSEDTQGLILGANYIGYTIMHLPSGVLADRFGGKWVLSLGVLFAAICVTLLPLSVKQFGPPGIITTRAFQGLGEGTVFPALSGLLAAWVPKTERGLLGAFVFGGGQFGTIISNISAGLILSQYKWPTLFYTFAIGAFCWFIVFTVMCYSFPDLHPCIKAKELEYLIEQKTNTRGKKKPPTPWKQILTNVPVLVTIVAQLGHDWGFYVMVSCLPKYMADVLNFSVKKNGYYSSLPYVAMWISSLFSGCLADYLIKHEIWSITTVRKVMTFVAAVPPGAFMVAASYSGCNRMMAVTCFTLSMFFMGPYYGGMKLGPLDMSPNYAGVLMALCNGAAALTGIAAPYTTGILTPNQLLKEWRHVFWLAFVILTLTAVIYAIWASGEVQPFDSAAENKEEK